MRPMDILKRPAPKISTPEPNAEIDTRIVSQTIVKPPQIPPQVPIAKKNGEYARLMKRHDRLNMRHVKKT